jgi:predicted metal-dependent enzyme (double-stranded beta helix superfamily)
MRPAPLPGRTMGSLSPATCEGLGDLIDRLTAAVRLGEVHDVTHHVKSALEDIISERRLRLPDHFRETRADSYARRLLYRDPQLGYAAVVMVWAPGQRTALHDHSGIWCVEGVLEGRMHVTQYDLLEEKAGGYRFVESGAVTAAVGSAGCLIPPFEYHVLANALADQPSITLHVYGDEMRECSIFEPRPDGLYQRRVRQLSYTD